jgi:hypothetical protein
MESDHTARAGSIDGNAGPLEIIEVADTIRENGERVASGGVFHDSIVIGGEDVAAIDRESADVDGGLRTHKLVQRYSGCTFSVTLAHSRSVGT